LNSDITESDLSNKEPSMPTINAKTAHAISILNIATTLSPIQVGKISPYPIVVTVVKAQKAAVSYSSSGVIS
jgi:uncharacterized membrane protein YccF (DUF307 family)